MILDEHGSNAIASGRTPQQWSPFSPPTTHSSCHAMSLAGPRDLRHASDDDDDHDDSSSSSNNGHHRHQLHHHHHTHDLSYYALCLLGGGLSSSVRGALTPLDLVKCNLQAHPGLYPNLRQGLQIIWHQHGLQGLYRGLTPTVLAYGTQSGVKYASYEYLKHQWSSFDDGCDNDGGGYRYNNQTAVYMLSAALAEGLADIFMCPWEMLKVKMQTTLVPTTNAAAAAATESSSFPTRFGPALVAMVQHRQAYRWPFGSLPPLWGRQIIGTVANFVTFEHVANMIYNHLLDSRTAMNPDYDYDDDDDGPPPPPPPRSKDDLPRSVQLGVSLVSGYVSGLVSTVVSHPADSLLSLQARYPESTWMEIIQRVGWKRLATKGLGLRAAKTGTIIACQWLIYDAFKSAMGMGTTGGH